MNTNPLREVVTRTRLAWSSAFFRAMLSCGHETVLARPGAYKQKKARCAECAKQVATKEEK